MVELGAGVSESPGMMRPSNDLPSVYLCSEPVDFRKGLHALAVLVESQLILSRAGFMFFVIAGGRGSRLPPHAEGESKTVARDDTHLAPPESLTGKALSYLHHQWERLVRYLDEGRLEIDNNPASARLSWAVVIGYFAAPCREPRPAPISTA